MKNKICYRKAILEDALAVAELNMLVIKNDLSHMVPVPGEFSKTNISIEDEKEKVLEQIEDPDYEIIVAELEQKIVGVLILFQENYSDDLVIAPFSTIENICTHPDYRHLGVGQGLFAEAESIARLKKHQFIDLLVWESNQNAISLYQRNGFLTIERRMVKKLE